MHRRSGEAVAFEGRPYVAGGVPEQSGQFHLSKSDLSDLGESSFEVLLHVAARGVQLEADALQPSRLRGSREPGDCSGTQSAHERSPIQHVAILSRLWQL